MARDMKLWRGLIAIVALLCAFGAGATPAMGANYGFDPTLSLTGGCATFPPDPVPDPGCPAQHAPSPFSKPRAVTTDSYGDIYVASYGNVPSEGRIDIFDASGVFITEVADPRGPVYVAVDSQGILYVFENTSRTRELNRYSPTAYDPTAGDIAYSSPPQLITNDFGSSVAGIAVDPVTGHLFVHYAKWITEYDNAAAGNPVIDETIGSGTLNADVGLSIAVDATHGLIYASDTDPTGFGEGWVRAFELAAPHHLVATLDGSDTPVGKFNTQLYVAVDEGTGHVFVYDGGGGSKVVYELTASGEYVSTISYGIKDIGAAIKLWVDNGLNSPNGALSSEGRYLFVPSEPVGVGHVLAYGPTAENPPSVANLSASGITATEAQLHATVDPGNLATHYTFEYISQSRFEEAGFSGAVVAPTGQLQAVDSEIPVSAPVTGLSPDTAYRFRVVATNSEGSDEAEGEFSTYPAAEESPSCPNGEVRVGASALLPDCRAYELVTPGNTNARSPVGVGHLGSYFAAPQASPDGSRVSFQIEGGMIPGGDGTGSFAGDPYLATRSGTGWTTASAGPNGAEAPKILPGSTSPDQGYSFWSTASPEGSAAVDGGNANYVRYPDGHSALVGRGSLGSDPNADGKLISENGGHIVFVSGTSTGPAVQLEPNAPPSGTRTIYDRTADEVTHVVSLLPNGKAPPAGQDALYMGASLDGTGIAFTVEGTLYLRYDNRETFKVGKELTFEGVAAQGRRIFYLDGGNLKAFDVNGGVVSFSTSGNVIPVNVSLDGTAAYFISPSVLTKSPNPNGAKAKAGQQNLYLSKEGAISFVGTVTERDVAGEFNGIEQIEGLGLWTLAVGPGVGNPGSFAKDPSRTTPTGAVLLFESRASLDGYDPAGHAEVYRYDSVDQALTCLSCNPTGASPAGQSSLQSISPGIAQPEPFGAFALIENLRSDGRRAVFQSEEALVPTDTDGLQDVYEWEQQGVGSCTRPSGCIYLISSGQSARNDYLFGISQSGDDVFFRTSDQLLSGDLEETPSVYDARVGGGFAEENAGVCQGEGCRTALPSSPEIPAPTTTATAAHRVKRLHCPKGMHKVKRHGHARCVKKHRKHRHHRHHAKKKGA
jgi:hypothetical protein